MIITLVGSTRFPDAFKLANMHLSMLGHIVLTVGCFGHVDDPIGSKFLTSDASTDNPVKQLLDKVYREKIDMCDAIMVINVGSYLGSGTLVEIEYAKSKGKTVLNFLALPHNDLA